LFDLVILSTKIRTYCKKYNYKFTKISPFRSKADTNLKLFFENIQPPIESAGFPSSTPIWKSTWMPSDSRKAENLILFFRGSRNYFLSGGKQRRKKNLKKFFIF
jgi:hypothetical protein